MNRSANPVAPVEGHKPIFSVVVPLHDDRGQAEKAIQKWIRQRRSGNNFEIVVVDSGKRQKVERIRRWLSAGDKIVSCNSSNEAELYNAGAREATAAWIFFTESHVLPRDDCVPTTAQLLAQASFDAAIPVATIVARTRLARIGELLTRQELPKVRQLGLWRSVGMRGLLIRRHVFDALGGLNESYYRFAETVLAIELVENNYSLVETPEIVTTHVEPDSILELAQAIVSGSYGNCQFWANQPELANKYFGGTMIEHCGYWPSPTAARRALRHSLSMIRRGERGAARQFLGQIQNLMLAALGWRWHFCCVSMRSVALTFQVLGNLLTWSETADATRTHRLIDMYQQMLISFRQIGINLCYARLRQPNKSADRTARVELFAESLLQRSTNFYATERWAGEAYAWSQPTASVYLPLARGAYVLRLDIRPNGNLSVRQPQFYLDGIEIPQEQVSERDGMIEFSIECRAKPTLAWNCIPFKPSECGLPDSRTLGIAIIRVEAVPIIEARARSLAA